MMFFLNFADPQGKIHHEEFVEIGKKHNIPTLIDAAADVPPVENLWRYTKMGFDLVGFSGGKGLRGPQSSGLLLGRKDLIEAARLNNSPNGDTLCRTNKVNKEEIIGMLVALEILPEGGPRRGLEGVGGRCQRDHQGPRGLRRRQDRGLRARDRQRGPPPARSPGTTKKRGRDASAQMVKKLREGEPSIEVTPGSRTQLVDRRLDDGARRGRDRRRADPRDPGRGVTTSRSRLSIRHAAAGSQVLLDLASRGIGGLLGSRLEPLEEVGLDRRRSRGRRSGRGCRRPPAAAGGRTRP